MGAFVLRRSGQAVVTLWAITTLLFFVMRLAPGDPIIIMTGPDATLAEIEALREAMGLNRPILVQYFLFLGNLLTFGHLGVWLDAG